MFHNTLYMWKNGYFSFVAGTKSEAEAARQIAVTSRESRKTILTFQLSKNRDAVKKSSPLESYSGR